MATDTTSRDATTERPSTCDCGHAPTKTDGIGTGYAIDATTHETRCYPCADDQIRAIVAASTPGRGSAITLYVSSDGRTITTWTGGRVMGRVSWGARHSWSPSSRGGEGGRCYLTAVDNLGRVWSGVGEPGMWTTLRLTKRVDGRQVTR